MKKFEIRRLSREPTFINKRFPHFPILLLYTYLAITIILELTLLLQRDGFDMFGAGMVLGMGWIMVWRSWIPVDEVWDECDALLIRAKGQEERILFSEIQRVSFGLQFKGEGRITILLHRPGLLGRKIVFDVPFKTSPHTIVESLRSRLSQPSLFPPSSATA